MREVFKGVVLVFAFIILMIGVMGCMKTDKTNQGVNSENVKMQAQDYLTKKYHKDFECVASEGASLTNNEYTFCFVEDGLPYEDAGFHVYYKSGAEPEFSDGYFGVVARDELTEFIFECGINSHVKVISQFSRTYFDEKLTATSTLDDAIDIYGTIRAYFYIFIPDGVAMDWDMLKSHLGNKNINGKINYYYLPEDMIESIEYSNFNEIIGDIENGTILCTDKGSIGL